MDEFHFPGVVLQNVDKSDMAWVLFNILLLGDPDCPTRKMR